MSHRDTYSIEINACGGCGRHVVMVSDNNIGARRINRHKCNGQWKVIDNISLTADEWKNLADHIVESVLPSLSDEERT